MKLYLILWSFDLHRHKEDCYQSEVFQLDSLCMFAEHLWQQNVGCAFASGTKELVTTNIVYTSKAFGFNYSFVLYLSIFLITFD